MGRLTLRRLIDGTLTAVGLALLAPAALAAQQQPLPPEAQALVVEMQELQAQLGPIQQQALSDAGLQAAQQELGEKVRAAMAEADPEMPARMERLTALQAEALEARAAQDQERMAAIVTEAQQIEQSLQAAQQQAIERPELDADIEAFQASLERKMVELDPDAAPLLERMREIDAELRALLQPAGG